MNETDTKASVGLEFAFNVVRRRAWVIVLCFVLTAAAAFVFSKAQTKQYTASAQLVFNNQSVAQQASGVQVTAQTDPTGQRATNLLLVQQAQNVSERAATALHDGLTPTQIRAAVTASQQGVSNVVSIAATWTSPVLAARIANAYTNAFIQEQSQSDQATVQNAVALVQQQILGLTRVQRATPQGQSLLDRLESLKVLKAMQNPTQVVRAAAVPAVPSSPKVLRNVVLAALLGLIIGLGIGFQLERSDQRLREPGEVEAAFGLPMLGLIPHGQQRGTADIDLDPFRMLRAHLRYYNVDRALQLLLVTSAVPTEGKTTTARGLAAAAAGMGTKTLLIEADLRRPTIARVLGLQAGIGLTGALIESGRVEDAIQQINVDGQSVDSETDRVLDLLPAGATPPNPAELLESHAMEGVLTWAREHYELVVIDTAPLAVVPDAIPLMKRVDGVIIVSRIGLSKRDAAERLRERLDQLDAPVLGLVVNDLQSRSGGYGYGYGYGGYGYEPRKEDRANGGDPAAPFESPAGGQREAEDVATRK